MKGSTPMEIGKMMEEECRYQDEQEGNGGQSAETPDNEKAS